MLEFRIPDAALVALGGAPGKAWNTTNQDTGDAEIRSVSKESEIITPDNVRKKGLTVEQSFLQHCWPSHRDVKKKIYVPDGQNPIVGLVRNPYRANSH